MCFITFWRGILTKSQTVFFSQKFTKKRSENCKVLVFFFLSSYSSYLLQPHDQTSKDFHSSWCCLVWWSVDRWYLTPDMWQMTCDTWHVTLDMWHMTCDRWHVTHDILNMTCEMWYVTHGRFPFFVVVGFLVRVPLSAHLEFSVYHILNLESFFKLKH